MSMEPVMIGSPMQLEELLSAVCGTGISIETDFSGISNSCYVKVRGTDIDSFLDEHGLGVDDLGWPSDELLEKFGRFQVVIRVSDHADRGNSSRPYRYLVGENDHDIRVGGHDWNLMIWDPADFAEVLEDVKARVAALKAETLAMRRKELSA